MYVRSADEDEKKKGRIFMIAILAVLVLVFVGYNVYRYPAMSRSLSDESLGQEEVNRLRDELAEQEDKQVLVAYFSYFGNTRTVAEALREETGADLLEIQPETPYPEDYDECGEVALEERDSNARPAIANLPESIEEYDTILVGYPIWWHTAPMIIGTFLESYDLTGKDVYPFTQSASMAQSSLTIPLPLSVKTPEMPRYMTGCLRRPQIRRPLTGIFPKMSWYRKQV